MSLKNLFWGLTLLSSFNLMASPSRGTLVVRIPAQSLQPVMKIVHFDEALPESGDENIALSLAEKALQQIDDGQAVSVDECQKLADEAEARYRRIARQPSRYEIKKIRDYVCAHAKESGSNYEGVYGEYFIKGRAGQMAKSLASYYPGLSQAYVGLHPNFHYPIAVYSGAYNPWASPWTPWGFALFRYGYWYLYYR